MFHFGLFTSTKTSKVKSKRNNHQSKVRLLVASLFLSQISAVNSDKVSFQIFEIDSPLGDIMWCGNTNEVILVQSELGTIYRSRDRGDSWKKLHSVMHQTAQSVVDEGQTVSNILQLARFNLIDFLFIQFILHHLFHDLRKLSLARSGGQLDL